MARGFESKSVADQQEAAFGMQRERAEPKEDPVRAARRRKIELARVDVARRLAQAQSPAHRQGLERALAALDAELAELG
jgi:hypothetical protein